MVGQEWLSAEEAAAYLNININHLRQLQFRKQLIWGKREGRKVYYKTEQVLALGEKRKPK